jgi:phage-related protein
VCITSSDCGWEWKGCPCYYEGTITELREDDGTDTQRETERSFERKEEENSLQSFFDGENVHSREINCKSSTRTIKSITG